jgi:hypothetical protein
MMPNTVPTMPIKAGHMNFSSLWGLMKIIMGKYVMMYRKKPTMPLVVVPALKKISNGGLGCKYRSRGDYLGGKVFARFLYDGKIAPSIREIAWPP